jgi:hypothetical protein
MVDPFTVQMIRDTAAIIGVVVALGYYVINIQNQRETRQAQLFMHLFDRYREKDTWRDGYELFQMDWKDLDEFFQKYDSSVNMDNFEKRYSIWTFFDGLGMLLKKGLVDKEMIYYLMGGYSVYWYWSKFGDVIRESRIRLNSPDHMVMFEYLAGEMKKMKVEREHDMDIPSNWGDFSRDN